VKPLTALAEIHVDIEWPLNRSQDTGRNIDSQIAIPGGSRLTESSGVIWIAISPVAESDGRASRASASGSYPLPPAAHPNATVGDIVGSEEHASLLIRIDIRGSYGHETTGMNALRGGGSVTVWRSRASTAMYVPLAVRRVVGNWTDSYLDESSLPWQPTAGCGRTQLVPTDAGRLRLAIPHSLLEASQSVMERLQLRLVASAARETLVYDTKRTTDVASSASGSMLPREYRPDIAEMRIGLDYNIDLVQQRCGLRRVVQIVAGTTHACALLDTGKMRCWGRAASGQLGTGSTTNVLDPSLLPDDIDVDGRVDSRVVQIAAGSDHTCALLDTEKMRCWGSG